MYILKNFWLFLFIELEGIITEFDASYHPNFFYQNLFRLSTTYNDIIEKPWWLVLGKLFLFDWILV